MKALSEAEKCPQALGFSRQIRLSGYSMSGRRVVALARWPICVSPRPIKVCFRLLATFAP
ncbi:MAG: hypothetical protein L6435_05335 [Anaerolineae bacterium]|nr:hypothetical protein [Anaerolineae bacterium]